MLKQKKSHWKEPVKQGTFEDISDAAFLGLNTKKLQFLHVAAHSGYYGACDGLY